MKMRALVVATMLSMSVFAGVLKAQNLDMAVGAKSVQVKYNTLAGGSTYGRTEVNLSVLYNEDLKSTLGEIGVLVVDSAGSKTPGTEVGIGPKLWVTDQDQGNAVAIGLGGKVRYKSSQQDRLFVRARLFYAPSIVSFGDAESMYEAGIEFGYEVLPTADAYVGFRHIETDYQGTNEDKLDEGAYVGMKLQF